MKSWLERKYFVFGNYLFYDCRDSNVHCSFIILDGIDNIFFIFQKKLENQRFLYKLLQSKIDLHENGEFT
jgi:hypothetical protein